MLRHFVQVDRRVRRLYVHGRRVHHGTLGVVLCFAGALLAYHDRRDHRDWLRFTRL